MKPLYGHQEGARVGYNPHKPGRPSHTCHSYIMANTRLVLEVDVQAGDQSHSSHSMPGLVDLLKRLPEDSQPAFIRGDCEWGNNPVMSFCHYAAPRNFELLVAGDCSKPY